nr:immunoglobulin light chain junction region [Macaca mulatta]
CQQNSSWPLTF